MERWIETERLILREYVEADWKAIHEYASQEEILVYENWGPNSVADTKEFIQNALKLKEVVPIVGRPFFSVFVVKLEDRIVE